MPTAMAARKIACISLADLEKRDDQIAAELAHAATEIGFLQVKNSRMSEHIAGGAVVWFHCTFDSLIEAWQQVGTARGVGAIFKKSATPPASLD